MVVFNKKRIIFLLSCLIISFIGMNLNFSPSSETVPTSSTPVSGYTIVLDAGHRKSRSVELYQIHGIYEEEINLKIVLKLQELLEQSGSTVILTRSDENGIYDLDESSIKNKKTSDLKNRVKIANTSEADIFVSVHLNKLDLEYVHGWQTFYQKNNEESKKLASLIQSNLNYSIQKENKREILELSRKIYYG